MKVRNFVALAASGVVLAGVAVEYRKWQLEKECEELVRLLDIGPGSRVADIGAGTGEMAALVAARVGNTGHVYAAEMDPEKLRKLRRRARSSWRLNFTVVESREDDCGIPPNSCDAIFMRDSYHHLTRPREMNQSILRALRPGGKLAVIDFAPRWWLAPWTPKGIPGDRGGHGIRPELVRDELADIGFEPVRLLPQWSRGVYCAVLSKPEQATAAPPSYEATRRERRVASDS